MDWSKPLDEYCERISPEFWAEPVNALSNISFVLGAIFAYRFAHQNSIKKLGVNWLIFMLVVVGIGSFLYHTNAVLWSMFTDLLPIYIFQLSSIAFYGAASARQLGHPQFLGGFLFLIAFIVLTLLFSQFPREVLNGSIAYFPAMISLVAMGAYQFNYSSYERFTLLGASSLFAVALLFRSIDNEICGAYSIGTHFLWHLANGCVLYLVIRAYVGLLITERESIH